MRHHSTLAFAAAAAALAALLLVAVFQTPAQERWHGVHDALETLSSRKGAQ